MSNVINFLCPGCQASLSIPWEMAGVSGPCPLCSAYVTSPPPAGKPVRLQPPRKEIPPRPSEAEAPRVWLQPHLVEGDEGKSAAARPRRKALYVTAGLLLFTGAGAGAWRLWEPPAPEKTANAGVSPEPLRPHAVIRPEIQAVDDPGNEVLPPPSEVPPAARIPARSPAVAQNLSGGPAVSTPVNSPPVPAPVSGAGPAVKNVAPGAPKKEVQPTGEMSAAEKEIRKVVPVDGHLAKPGNALIHFLAATKWQERLKYTLAPEKVKPLMEAYYKTWPDGAIVPEDIKLTRIEATEEDPNRKYYAFLLYLPEVETGIPVSIEDTKSGCLVEWCSFAESKDRVLSKFFETWRKEPGTFRVLIRRSHYFSDDVPDQKKKECLSVQAPDGTGPFTIWMDKDKPDYARYFAKGDRQRWDVSSPLVITCQWEKTDKGVQYVRLTDVVMDSWHPDLLPAATPPRK